MINENFQPEIQALRLAGTVTEVHKGAEHGYALPNRDIYDNKATLRDWEIIHAMFRRQLFK